MTIGLLSADVVNILSWKSAYTSSAYLVFFNVGLWVLQRQRPVCGFAVVLLVYYLQRLWKHRIRPEVLVDPPDHEDWVTLSTYDLQKSTTDCGRRIFKAWLELRNKHYLMWLTLTSVFWIVLAKFSSYVSFPVMLFVISNGSFLAGLLLKHKWFDIHLGQGCDASEDILTTSLADAAEDLNAEPLTPCLRGLTGISQELISSRSDPSLGSNSSKEAQSGEGSTGSPRQEGTPEPESLTPYGVPIPSHEDSSDEEFLFDPKHFESSSSSASNSFELLHF